MTQGLYDQGFVTGVHGLGVSDREVSDLTPLFM